MATKTQWGDVEKITLVRDAVNPDITGTTGTILEVEGVKTLELPWLENRSRVSCIPTGIFRMWFGKSYRFKGYYWRVEVPGRPGILLHKGNKLANTLGCPLIGGKIVVNPETKEYEIAAGTSTPAYVRLLAHLSKAKNWKLEVR